MRISSSSNEHMAAFLPKKKSRLGLELKPVTNEKTVTAPHYLMINISFFMKEK